MSLLSNQGFVHSTLNPLSFRHPAYIRNSNCPLSTRSIFYANSLDRKLKRCVIRTVINCLHPPLIPPRAPRVPPTISYGKVLEQAVQSLEDFVKGDTGMSNQPGAIRLTIDFPPERSETRAGTLVSRFENNLNFISTLAERLGTPETGCERLGPDVEIRDNVNPQGGGEYITDDECMIGLRIPSWSVLDGRRVSLLLNAGVDAATLKQIQTFDDDEKAVVVLVNCALDRVSWFAKFGFAKYLDSFSTAYYLKAIAPSGWLLKCGEEPWTAFVNSSEGAVLVEQFENRPSIVDVESKIRLFMANVAS